MQLDQFTWKTLRKQYDAALQLPLMPGLVVEGCGVLKSDATVWIPMHLGMLAAGSFVAGAVAAYVCSRLVDK